MSRQIIVGWGLWALLVLIGVAVLGCSDEAPIEHVGTPDIYIEDTYYPPNVEVQWTPSDDRELIANCIDVIDSCMEEIDRLNAICEEHGEHHNHSNHDKHPKKDKKEKKEKKSKGKD